MLDQRTLKAGIRSVELDTSADADESGRDFFRFIRTEATSISQTADRGLRSVCEAIAAVVQAINKFTWTMLIDLISASVRFDADGIADSWWIAEERAMRSKSDQDMGKAIKEELGPRPVATDSLHTYLERAAVGIHAASASFDEQDPEIAKHGATLKEAINNPRAVSLNLHIRYLLSRIARV